MKIKIDDINKEITLHGENEITYKKIKDENNALIYLCDLTSESEEKNDWTINIDNLHLMPSNKFDTKKDILKPFIFGLASALFLKKIQNKKFE